VRGWSELSLAAVLKALGDAPRAYRVAGPAGGGGRAAGATAANAAADGDAAAAAAAAAPPPQHGGLSKRRVAWFGPVAYAYGGQSFPAGVLPPLLQELAASVSEAAAAAAAAGRLQPAYLSSPAQRPFNAVRARWHPFRAKRVCWCAAVRGAVLTNRMCG
jgi:hypothetical protein